jgi:hypothetical protein
MPMLLLLPGFRVCPTWQGKSSSDMFGRATMAWLVVATGNMLVCTLRRMNAASRLWHCASMLVFCVPIVPDRLY